MPRVIEIRATLPKTNIGKISRKDLVLEEAESSGAASRLMASAPYSRHAAQSAPDRTLLPPRFAEFFARRGWTPRAHQLAFLKHAEAGEDALLIAPTGAGKTLAGFLPTLVDLDRPRNRRGLHTLYISPLKALAVDVARNLEIPIAEMGLAIRVETRTGDTSISKRQRQRRDPPDILLTTPEQLALLLASADARYLFADLKRVVIDELHAIAASKRGDLLCLGLARLRDHRAADAHHRPFGDGARSGRIAPLARRADRDHAMAHLVTAPPGRQARHLDSRYAPSICPGRAIRRAMRSRKSTRRIKAAHMTLVFVNTRAQAEFAFAELWRINEDKLPIALHHGSLDVGQRRRVEAAMAEGRLKAVVCTSTLDLGIDWGDVDLVINVGAPKGASRLMQRIGRANHRLDEPSRAILVPSNRFEVLECRAAVDAAYAGAQDTPSPAAARSTCSASIFSAWPAPSRFDADELFREVISAEPYRELTREDFDAALAFVAHGGYALASYERFAKIKQQKDGRWRIANRPRRADLSDECRHDRRSRHAESAPRARQAGQGRRLYRPAAARRPRARRDRGIFSGDAGAAATRFCSAAKFWRCAALSRTRRWSRAPRRGAENPLL